MKTKFSLEKNSSCVFRTANLARGRTSACFSQDFLCHAHNPFKFWRWMALNQHRLLCIPGFRKYNQGLCSDWSWNHLRALISPNTNGTLHLRETLIAFWLGILKGRTNPWYSLLHMLLKNLFKTGHLTGNHYVVKKKKWAKICQGHQIHEVQRVELIITSFFLWYHLQCAAHRRLCF